MVIVVSPPRNGIVVIKLSGRLVHPALYTLRPRIRGLLESGIRAIIFDLGEVPHCDSSGCGEMIGAYTTLLKADAALAFVKLTPKVRLLWERINVTRIFNIFDTVEEAESFLEARR